MLQTTVKGAILAAADTIEQHPERYYYMGAGVPAGEDDRACLWGFIGLHLGLEPGVHNAAVVRAVGLPVLVGTAHLYDFMEKTLGFHADWRKDAALAARGLRQYAELFEPSTTGEA